LSFLDAVLGRSKPAPANLDDLFALPPAAITLETDLGLTPTGEAGVCFKPVAGASFDSMSTEMGQLLQMTAEKSGLKLEESDDSYGYHWVCLQEPGLDDLVTNVHLVNSSLAEAGFGSQLLCSVFGFRAKDQGNPVYLVYLYKRGAFYPFAPTGAERRDNQRELRIQALLTKELKMEPELSRWFPIWGVPLAG